MSSPYLATRADRRSALLVGDDRVHADLDPDTLAAVYRAVNPVVADVHHRYGAVPAALSPEFLPAPQWVQRAGLLICGAAFVAAELFDDELVDGWLGLDYLDGQYLRRHHFPVIREIDRRRWPPTGDRELWIKYGPLGPPASLREAA